MVITIAGILSFIISWALVPTLRKLALRTKFVDKPNHRKIHQTPLPMLGGVALFVAFSVATAVMYFFVHIPEVKEYLGVMIGALILFAIGLLDDWYKSRGKDFPVAPRFLLQIIAAACVVLFGGKIRGISVPFIHPHFLVFPTFLSTMMTILWIVGVINVFNFLDGMDGLAAGIASISAMTLFFVAILKGEPGPALWSVAVAGACLGFLKHNFHPARIIMGDAGSTLLGFLLASIGVVGAFKSATIVSVFVPVLALGVPIFDALRVVIQRALKGQPVYSPDKTHWHHRLLDAGFSQVQTVTFMYLISLCFSLISLIVVLL